MIFFGESEIANLAKEERIAYEQRLKVIRDLKNVIDTAFIDGYHKSESQLIPQLEEEQRLRQDAQRLRQDAQRLRQEEQKFRQEERHKVSLTIYKMLFLGTTLEEISEILKISVTEVKHYQKYFIKTIKHN